MPDWDLRRVSLLVSLLVGAYALAVFLGQAHGASADQRLATWPTIMGMRKVFDFPDARRAGLSLEILGIDGDALYRLDCHTWRYEQDRDFDYSGDFECRLVPLYGKEMYSTLLTDNPRQSRDWESRGRFLVQELRGRCADYPEYGRVRTFRLRGMRLRLELSNVRVVRSIDNATRGPWVLSSFRLLVSAEPDVDARGAIAERVGAAAPPPECGPGYRAN